MVTGLLCCGKSSPLECRLANSKKHPQGRDVSGQCFVCQLLDYTLELRDTGTSPVVVDGDEGFELSDQLSVEIRSLLGTALGVSGDACRAGHVVTPQ